MADNQELQRRAQAEQNKTVFTFRMVGIVDQPGKVVMKHGLCFLKTHAVFLEIGSGLAFIPFELQCADMRSVVTM